MINLTEREKKYGYKRFNATLVVFAVAEITFIEHIRLSLAHEEIENVNQSVDMGHAEPSQIKSQTFTALTLCFFFDEILSDNVSQCSKWSQNSLDTVPRILRKST